jgi:hypothetical protein
VFANFIRFGPVITIALVIALIGSVLTSNPLFTALALIFPPIAAKLLWKRNEPPVLFLALIFQWLQVTVKVFYADFLDVDFAKVHLYPATINQAYLLCLTALYIEALGIHVVVRRFAGKPRQNLRLLSRQYYLGRTTLVYLGFSLAVPLMIASASGGIIQILYKLLDFKWSIFFMFYCITFLQGRRKYVFYSIILIEILVSFSGYFSGFKDFFMFAAICYLTLKQRLKPEQYVFLTLAAVLLFNVMIIWSAVKSDYRSYLSGGRRAQVITVTRSQALNVLYYRVKAVGKEDFRRGFRQFVDRLSYIDFFSAAKGYVPSHVGYENGRLWSDAVTRIFLPRILFPGKSVIDDSEKTRKYTGRRVAGAQEGTSISLGYITESYIDFGPLFMFVPLFFLGMFIGWVYSYIIRHTYNQLWGFACVIPLFFQIYTFELALDKAIGALFYYFMVFFLVRRFCIPLAERYLSKKVNLAEVAYSSPERIV